MDKSMLERDSQYCWRINPRGNMRVPAYIYGDEQLVPQLDDKVIEQLCNVASLPGIVKGAYAMPDAHWGYGFPIGGVAAFDADEGGVISAGGVGFDISCGVRTLRTGLTVEDLAAKKSLLADLLFGRIPAGVGSTGQIHLDEAGMNAMLSGGAGWAVKQGYGSKQDLQYIEEQGCMTGADAGEVSAHARKRQKHEMGTLGSGNHYLEVQKVVKIFRPHVAAVFGLREQDIVVSIHCGSRGLGHQIGTEYLQRMAMMAAQFHIQLPDRELACAPIHSDVGRSYVGAMRAGINCAMANRQIITHLIREVFAGLFPRAQLSLIYDVSHNTCKTETHQIDGEEKEVYIHRKGATRAFGPGHPSIPTLYREVGQPVLIGGSMGTGSYILAGSAQSEERAFSSSCHGAGRAMSRRAARKHWHGGALVERLAEKGIEIRSPSMRGIAEEAPDAYKDVSVVVDAAEQAGLSDKVAYLEPVICVKG